MASVPVALLPTHRSSGLKSHGLEAGSEGPGGESPHASWRPREASGRLAAFEPEIGLGAQLPVLNAAPRVAKLLGFPSREGVNGNPRWASV